MLKILATCVVGALICALILVTGPKPLEASLPQTNPQVSIVDLEQKQQPQTLITFGTLIPRQALELTTQVPGEITWVNEILVPGGEVAADEVLFSLDSRDFRIAVASAEARLAQAQAAIEIERGRVEVAQLEWSAWQEGQEKIEQPSSLALRKPQLAQSQADRNAAIAELDQAKLALERSTIRAPWPASVVAAHAVAGQVVTVGESVGTLFPLDYGVVEVQVPLKFLRVIETGVAGVELQPVDNTTNQVINGVFERVVKRLTEDTRLATIRVRVDQPLQHAGWVFGMHVQVTISAHETQNVVLIPADLIVSGNVVWVYRAGRAQRHQVFPLQQSGSRIAVVDNFVEGDALVVERPIGLFSGAFVDVMGL